jgi:hypothetical protein
MYALVTSQLLMPELRGAPVYARTTRRINFLVGNPQLHAVHSGESQFDRAGAAVHGRIVILASGGNADNLSFDVLRHFAELFDWVTRAGELIEGACGGDNER